MQPAAVIRVEDLHVEGLVEGLHDIGLGDLLFVFLARGQRVGPVGDALIAIVVVAVIFPDRADALDAAALVGLVVVDDASLTDAIVVILVGVVIFVGHAAVLVAIIVVIDIDGRATAAGPLPIAGVTGLEGALIASHGGEGQQARCQRGRSSTR